MRKIDTSHPAFYLGAPLIILTLLYKAGAASSEIAQSQPVLQIEQVQKLAELPPITLPRVMALPPGTNVVIRESDVGVAFSDPKTLLPPPPPPPPPAPIVHILPPSPLETLASTITFDAVSSEGVFVRGGIFTPWGATLGNEVILDSLNEKGHVVLRLGKETRAIQPKPKAPHMLQLKPPV